MNNWNKTTLSEVAEVRLSNVDKKTHKDEFKIRLCNYMDVYKNPFINSNIAKSFMIASCNKNELENFIIKEGQVAITKDSEKRDDIGISTYIAESFEDVVLGYHTALITPKKEALSGKYLNYWFNTKFAKIYFENNAGGSGQRCTLPIDIIKSIPLRLPAFDLQEKIASIFYDIDSKMELNNRINTELEAMAKTIYDYWFVQFDFPDKNGKPYKSTGGKLVWNDELKREIPEGWESLTLDYLGEIIGGSTPSREIESYFTKDGIPWITPKDLSLNTGKKFIQKGELDVTEQGKNSASLNILPKGTVLMSSRAPVGYLAIARNNVTTNQGFKSFVPKSHFTTEYLYYTIMNLLPVIENNASGSTFKEVSGSVLKTIFGLAPKENIIASYTNIVKPIFNMQENLEEENQQLASLRDWLLPMLMNGQVSIN